jgi:hypothetical protein
LQVNPQVLLAQLAFALETLVVHFLAQAPQLLMSEVSSTQEPLQFERVAEQPEVHADAEQLGVPASWLQ